MSTTPESLETNESQQQVLFVNFNQDASSVAVGTNKCFRLFAVKNGEELEKIHEAAMDDVCLIERLFSSSLVTLVSLNAPRKLRVSHFVKGTEICSHSYANTILAVKLNRLRVIVCLEESLHIHNIRDMKVLHTIRDTPPNPHGICDLTSDDRSFLAYPGSSQMGEVQIFDAANLQAVSMIPAHDSALAAIRFSPDGLKIATASEKGTVIRVFAVPTGEKLFDFRRGVKRCVHIHSLAFSTDALFLSSASNTSTVHIFKLDAHNQHVDDGHRSDEELPPTNAQSPSGSQQGGWMEYMSRTASAYLPAHMTDILQQDRSFATAKLPTATEKKATLALVDVHKALRLLVASSDGYLYIYNVDKSHGGECSLLRQHRLFTTSVSASADGSSIVSSTQQADGSPPRPGQGRSPDPDPPVPDQQQQQSSPSYAGAATTKLMQHSTVKLNVDTERVLCNAVSGIVPAADRLRLDDQREFPPMSHQAAD